MHFTSYTLHKFIHFIHKENQQKYVNVFRSRAAIKAAAQRELSLERKEEAVPETQEVTKRNTNQDEFHSGIFYTCALLGNDKTTITLKIKLIS